MLPSLKNLSHDHAVDAVDVRPTDFPRPEQQFVFDLDAWPKVYGNEYVYGLMWPDPSPEVVFWNNKRSVYDEEESAKHSNRFVYVQPLNVFDRTHTIYVLVKKSLYGRRMVENVLPLLSQSTLRSNNPLYEQSRARDSAFTRA